MLDNRNALLFIRGFPAIMDDKYDLNHHPNIRRTSNGGAPPYVHKEKQIQYTPLIQAFDFENAENYVLMEEEE